MFKIFRTLVLSSLCVMSALCAMGQLSRSMRQIPIGNSDFNGFARIDKMFYKLPLGNGRKADMFFKFTTDPRYEPKYMGTYWMMPFFDSSVIKTAPTRYVWRSPNHGTYTFNKSAKTDKGFEETYVLNTTGKWKLNVSKGEILICDITDLKSRYVFRDGKLSQFCWGDGADTFRLSYNARGYPLSVYNVSKNTESVRFNYNSERELAGIYFPAEKKSVLIAYAPFSVYGEKGDIVRGVRIVSSITFLDGRNETYQYKHEARKRRNYLTKGGKEGNAEVFVNKFLQKNGDGGEGFIEWDAESGLIMSDSGGEYKVCNTLFDTRNPDSNGKTTRSFGVNNSESVISYKKPEYKYAQVWGYSSSHAIKTTQDPDTGEETRTSYIGSPGKASMKIRKIEKRLAGEKDWKLTLSKIYDENGNLIREIDADGNIRSWDYNVTNEYVRKIEKFNGQIVQDRKTIKQNGDEEVLWYEENGDILFFRYSYDAASKIYSLIHKKNGEFVYYKEYSNKWNESFLTYLKDQKGEYFFEKGKCTLKKEKDYSFDKKL